MKTKLIHLIQICLFFLLSNPAIGQGWQWTKGAYSSASHHYAKDIAVAPDGSTYLVGYGGGPEFKFGSDTVTVSGITDEGYLIKISPEGVLNWSFVTYGDIVGVDVDGLGNVYITGYNALPAATFDTITLSTTGKVPFIAKADSSGSWQWAIQADDPAGGGNDFWINDFAVNDEGYSVVGGSYSNFLPLNGDSLIKHPLQSTSIKNGFLLTVDPDGNWDWARQGEPVKGTSTSEIFAVDIDKDRNVYCGGIFGDSVDFGSAIVIPNLGSKDLVVAKFDSTGTGIWVNTGGGSLPTEMIYGLSVSPDKQVFISGEMEGGATFDTISVIPSSTNNGLVAGLTQGGDWKWVKAFEGPSTERFYEIDASAFGKIYLVGYLTGSITLPPLPTTTISGASSLLLTEMDTSGTAIWAEPVNNSGNAVPEGLEVKSNQNIVICGGFTGPLMELGSDTLNAMAPSFSSGFAGEYGCGELNPIIFGLDTFYCSGGPSDILSGFPSGGIFSGPGMVDSVFNPAIAGVGIHFIQYTLEDSDGCSDSVSLSTAVDICLNLEEDQNDFEIAAYPNPASNKLSIEWTNSLEVKRIFLRDLAGSVLKVVSPKASPFEINISDLASGCYLLEIEVAGGANRYLRVIRE